MQNLFDKASLVMVPSGYDNGKLYNIKPEDKGSAFEFERATMATRVNSSGLIETMFPEATNYVTYSNEFNNSSVWGGQSNYNITGNQEGYDGSSDAWLIEKTSTGNSYLSNSLSFTGKYTASVYAKAGTADSVFIYATGGYMRFNLLTGETYNGGGTYTTAGMDFIGNGWYRCYVVGTTTNTYSLQVWSSDTDYTTGTVYIQDAQLEAGYFATPYIETTTQAVTRQNQANQPRIDYSSGGGALLLEPGRTNLLAYSEDFEKTSTWLCNYILTPNYTTSPDGGNNAYRVQVGTTNGNLRGNVTVSSSTDYVFSFYVKRGTAVDMKYRIYEPVTGDIVAKTSYYSQTSSEEWVRIEVPFTTGATTTSVWVYIDSDSQGNGDFYAWGAQLEQGSYATSYIPTNGQQETRAGDVCGTGGYDSVFNNSQGTLYMEFKSPTSGNSSAWINLSSGTDTDDWLFFGKDQDRLRVYLKQNNVLETSDTSTILPTNFTKASVTYNTSSFKLNLDGVEIFDKNISPNFANNLDTLSFGSTTSTPLPEKIEVKTLCYFPEALTDEELQRLTSPSADATTFTELANNNGYTIL